MVDALKNVLNALLTDRNKLFCIKRQQQYRQE